jgi:glucokinase
VVVAPPNLKGWHNVPLRDLIQGQMGTETYVGNDANLAALAENTMGAAHGYSDVLFLTISTGIGGGVITGGKLLIGSEGLGAECGHIIMVVDGEVRDWEYQAAGPGIARQAREAIEKGETSSMVERAGGSVDAINGQIVGEAANAGDPLAVKLIERAGKMIGLAIVSFLHTFNPQIVVIGGGVAEGTWDLLNKPMWDAIKQYSMDSAYWEHLIITQATLGENVSLIGAAALALKKGG